MFYETKICVVVPARSGSKGLKDKNLADLGGHPLLAHSILAAQQAGALPVYVSTDSSHYAKIAKEYGAEVPFLRPSELATDTAGDYEVMTHFLETMEKEQGRSFDFFVHLRPTTPLRDPLLIKQAIEKILQSPEATALRSIHLCSESAYKKVELSKDQERLVTIFENDPLLDKVNGERQEYPETYTPNGYVDVLKTSTLKKGHIHGNHVLPFITEPVVEVDSSWELYLNQLIFDSKEGGA